MKKLTPKQQCFADEYIRTGNATQAAVLAGYSRKYTNTNANKLLHNTAIHDYIDKRNAAILNRRIASIEEIKESWTAIMLDDGIKTCDRLKASELLAKSYGVFLDKPEPENGRLLELISELKW